LSSYNAKGGHGYGDQRHGSGKSRFSWGKWKKPKEVINVVRPEEDKPKAPIPDLIHWVERPLPEGTKVFLNRPTTLTSNNAKFLLSNDLDKQPEIGFQICQLSSENMKLSLGVVLPDSSVRKFKIINVKDQLPSDTAIDFSDLVYVGNLHNQLRTNGFTLISA
jgi:hypothetical protein